MNSLDVVIPVLNESENLPFLFSRINKSLKHANITYRMIVVDDHSTDNTKQIVLDLKNKYPLTYLLKKGKKGKAYSILEGVEVAKSEWIVMIDADLQYPPSSIPKMLKIAMSSPTVGVVIGERNFEKDIPFRRKVVTKISRFINGRMVMGLNMDTQSGLKLFRKDIAKHIKKKQIYAWAFDIPLIHTALHLGYQIKSVKILFKSRVNGVSKLKFLKATLEILCGALKLRLSPSTIYKLSSFDVGNMLGAGVIYKKKKYITHSTLDSDKTALRTITFWQKVLIVTFLLTLMFYLFAYPVNTAITVMAVLTFIYFADALFNSFLIVKSLHFPPELNFSNNEIKSINNNTLPVYTVLSPLYREGSIVPQFINNMKKIDYPKDKLDIIILLEENDTETSEVLNKINLPGYIRVLTVPDSEPKTKPKACNYGLAHAKGEYVVIYDAEDQPDPLQLKKAYLGFIRLGEKVTCLQAKLNYYNSGQNFLTRLFTAEYSLWFDVILPALQSIDTTIPLGGTSNHFRTAHLKILKGWDPFNVTEDADLGMRLFKEGGKTAIINSVTLEEANSNLLNWIRQRSRWIKGYMQTYLVHIRKSHLFLRKHKRHFFIFQLISGLRISFLLINPFMWLMTISYFVLNKYVGSTIESLYPAPIFYMALTSAVFGNFLYLYYYMVGAAKRKQWEIIKYIYFIPVYWVLTSVAAFVAIYQLIFKPHFWEKTIHGLHLGKQKKPKFSYIFAKSWNAGGVLILASLAANLSNFLYSAFLGREIEISEFGTVSLISSIFSITAIFTSALGKTITYKTAYLLGKFGITPSNFTIPAEKKAWIASGLISLLWILSIPLMSIFFRTDSYLPFILFIPAMSISFISSFYSGFLHGNMMFSTIALLVIVESVAKLLLTILLVSIGLPGYVYLSIPLSLIISFVISWRSFKKVKTVKITDTKDNAFAFPKDFFSASILTKLSSVSFLSFDILLAKHFLSPLDAGRYSLLSLSGKIIYFLGSLFTQFINSFVSRDEGAEKNSAKTFIKIFTLTGLASLAGFLLIGVFGYITVPVLFGEKTESILHLLPLYGMAISLFTLTSAIINYHQIKKRYIFPIVGFFFAILQTLWISMSDRNLESFAYAFTQIAVVQFVTVLILNFWFVFFNKTIPVLSKKSSILIFNWRDIKHPWSGGAEVYIHEIAKRLVKKGHKVTIFSAKHRKNIPNENIDGVKVIRKGGFFTVYIWAFLYYIFHLRYQCDVIIDSENGIPFFTPLYAKKKILLLIHHVHQEVFRIRLKPPLSWIGKFLEKRLMPRVYKNTEIVTVSPSSKEEILLHKLTNKEPRVVLSGVDLNIYKPGKKSKTPLVLYLGRLTPQKSLTTLIEAAKSLVDKVPTVKIVIAGDGTDKVRLQGIVNSLGLGDVIEFTGKVTEEEKVRLFQKAWVFVNPSQVEGWGITTIEANACGTPVVASNVAGLKDAVNNPHSGYLVPFGDINKFSKTIHNLLTDHKKRKELSEGAKVWAGNFDWAKSADAFSRLSKKHYD